MPAIERSVTYLSSNEEICIILNKYILPVYTNDSNNLEFSR